MTSANTARASSPVQRLSAPWFGISLCSTDAHAWLVSGFVPCLSTARMCGSAIHDGRRSPFDSDSRCGFRERRDWWTTCPLLDVAFRRTKRPFESGRRQCASTPTLLPFPDEPVLRSMPRTKTLIPLRRDELVDLPSTLVPATARKVRTCSAGEADAPDCRQTSGRWEIGHFSRPHQLDVGIENVRRPEPLPAPQLSYTAFSFSMFSSDIAHAVSRGLAKARTRRFSSKAVGALLPRPG